MNLELEISHVQHILLSRLGSQFQDDPFIDSFLLESKIRSMRPHKRSELEFLP